MKLEMKIKKNRKWLYWNKTILDSKTTWVGLLVNVLAEVN